MRNVSIEHKDNEEIEYNKKEESTEYYYYYYYYYYLNNHVGLLANTLYPVLLSSFIDA